MQDFREAVTKAIERGTALKEFRSDFDAIVAKSGWVHNGSAAWRSQIIYETNLSTAYSAGRYAQMTEPDVLEAFPYWRYQHNAAIHPRQQHIDWSGLVLPANDPWWGTHYPPNGWRCHCSVSAVSEGGLRRMGRTVPDRAPPVDMQPRVIKTGDGLKTVEVPRGIDPGFGYNPGQAWLDHADRPVVGQLPARPVGTRPRFTAEAVHVHPTDDIGAAPPRPAFTTLPRPPATPDQVQAFLQHPIGNLRVGVLNPDVAMAIGTKQREVLLSADTMEKQLEHHPNLTHHDYAALPQIIASPSLVVLDGDRRVVLLRKIGDLYYAAVKRTGDAQENYVVTLFRCRPGDVRRIAARGQVLSGSVEATPGRGLDEAACRWGLQQTPHCDPAGAVLRHGE